MPFDLSAVTARANEVMNRVGGGNGEKGSYKYKLVYPLVGTTSVKLLFNPKANSVARIINNHRYDGKNIPCMRTWNEKCPICDAAKEVKNATGNDYATFRSITRGISLAQYVSSTYELDDVKPGDIILLMYPWTVYKDINQILQQARTGEELSMLVAQNEGFVFDITHGDDNRYSTQINAFNKYKSCNSDSEFENLLNGLDSLNDLYRPATPTEEQLNTVNDVAKEIRDKYLSNSTNTGFGQNTSFNQPSPTNNFSYRDDEIPFRNGAPSYQVSSVAQNTQTPTNQATTVQAPMQQQSLPSMPKSNPTGLQIPAVTDSTESMTNRPACFGRYGDPSINPAQCGLCGSDFDCIAASGN